MALLDSYVDALAEGRNPEMTMPGVTAHLRSCLPCIEDFGGLLAAMREHGCGLTARRVRKSDPAG
jgi:hypothetical protein